MQRLRGLLAAGFLLTAGVSAASCGGDSKSPSTTPDETGGAGGAETGGTDAGSLGGEPSIDAATGSGGSMDGGGGSVATEAGEAAPPPPPKHCGNGTVEAALGEECEDGNEVNGDGCEASCKFTCTVGTDEVLCDDGNFCNGAETCNADHHCVDSTTPVPEGTICGTIRRCQGGVCLKAPAVCHDDLLVPPEEECEDTNADPSDGCDECRFTCVSTDAARDCKTGDPCEGRPECDDSVHTCVAGTPLSDLTPCATGKACVAGVCTDKFCGNGTIDADVGEECEDGNKVDGDGCDNCRYSCVPTDSTRDCHSSDPCYTSGICNTTTHQCPPPVTVTAGTNCGSGLNCIAGNCRAIVCGDGIQAVGAEPCDDGNRVSGDGCNALCKVSCVDPLKDCGTPPPCRKFSCSSSTFTCTSDPDPGKDGTGCNTGAGSATCKDGACTIGVCGNGNKEMGEQCDSGGFNGPNAGCEADCRFSCQQGADCNNLDPCDGAEVCDGANHVCNRGTAAADGTSCGGSGKICIRGGCAVSICGDGHTDPAIGEECDPPNTAGCDSSCKAKEICDFDGTSWALKVTANVTFGDGTAIMLGSGQILQWAKLTFAQTGTTLTGSLAVCGLSIPDFLSGEAAGSEWYGLDVPNAMFDSGGVPPFAMTGTASNLSPGAKIALDSTATLLGVTASSPFDAWPSTWQDVATSNFTPADQDADGNVGITLLTKTGPLPASVGTGNYGYPIVNVEDLANLGRADQLHVIIRQIASQAGTLDSCTTMSGTTTVSSIDVHVLGCHRFETQVACLEPEWNLADLVRPVHTVSDASFVAKKLTAGTTCADVRQVVP